MNPQDKTFLKEITVVGGGLAGSSAALEAAKRGIPVKLYEMRPNDAGEAGFLNSFMNKEQYLNFRNALVSAEQHPLHDFERRYFFEGCLPV